MTPSRNSDERTRAVQGALWGLLVLACDPTMPARDAGTDAGPDAGMIDAGADAGPVLPRTCLAPERTDPTGTGGFTYTW